MLLHALDKIDTKYILYMCEDQIIVKDVITDNFTQAISYMDKHDITKIRCLSMPEPDTELDIEEGIINNKNFGFISLKMNIGIHYKLLFGIKIVLLSYLKLEKRCFLVGCLKQMKNLEIILRNGNICLVNTVKVVRL